MQTLNPHMTRVDFCGNDTIITKDYWYHNQKIITSLVITYDGDVYMQTFLPFASIQGFTTDMHTSVKECMQAMNNSIACFEDIILAW